MQINRRSFIKTLTYGALSCTAGGFSVDSLMADCMPSDFVCILLHGLFFMQFKGDKLIVATPKFQPHTFGMREQGQPNIGPLPHGAPDINWTSVGLVPNANSIDFPQFPDIPQFSRGETGVGELMPVGTQDHEFQLILPSPQEIHGFRQGQLQNFLDCTESNHPKPGNLKPMQENIKNHCGPNFSLVTGLVYKKTNEWKHKNVVSFYAEHSVSCMNLKAADTNNALCKGKKLFAHSENFDLIYKDPAAWPPAVCPDKTCAFGVSPDDQFSAFELTLTPPACCQTRGVNPINCAQFGVIA
jgi:hypothetical protein